MHGAPGPQLHRQQQVHWLHPHTLGSTWQNTLMELPWVLRRALLLGMVAVEGAWQAHWDSATVSPGTSYVNGGSFPEPEATPTPISPGRSNKGAVGNCVTTMVHNHYTPSEKVPPPPKSSNHTAPSLK